jgi:hypothetical protein
MSLVECYRAVILITEEEMWQLKNESPKQKGVPRYYCITRNDGVQFFPSIDPAKCQLLCEEWVI